MIELREIIDDIRAAERKLSTVANRREVVLSRVEKTAKAMIQAATHPVHTAKDEMGKAMLELQRLDSVARKTLKSIEVEFVAAEDSLESLRDDLRIPAKPADSIKPFSLGFFVLRPGIRAGRLCPLQTRSGYTSPGRVFVSYFRKM